MSEAQIKGVIVRPDGLEVQFSLFADGTWMQWGQESRVLGETTDLLQAMRDAVSPELQNLDPCVAAGEHQTGADHRWQECPVWHEEDGS